MDTCICQKTLSGAKLKRKISQESSSVIGCPVMEQIWIVPAGVRKRNLDLTFNCH